MLHKLREPREYALLGVTIEMNEDFPGSSPFAKESKNLPGNRSCRHGQSPSEIMKKQPTVPPVCEQARCPSQLDPCRHSVRLAQYAAEIVWNFSKPCYRSPSGTPLSAFFGFMPVVRFLRGLRPFSFFFFFLGAVFFFFAIVIYSFLEAPDPFRGIRSSNWYTEKADGLSTP